MNEETEASRATRNKGPRLAPRQPSRWASEGVVVLAIVLVAGYALLRPAPETLPDFNAFERVEERKQAFFGFLAPIVVSENERVLEQRRQLLEIAPRVADGERLPFLDRRWMKNLAAEYELAWPGESREETLALLLRRVDTVPAPLALVQAAKESGWGRSRFARQGNNLFGHWCYARGCGIVPSRRNTDAAHEVAAFDSVRESVRRYINNLNTHPSYLPLRRIRLDEREAGRRPQALSLADGLIRYSERREAYVEEIKQIIRANRELIGQAMNDDSAASASAAAAGAP
ncbi:glucosaminidase domain-containing protein [Wenzhouxiangella sediminis]|uniref:Bax protein n=1 Tax=Wenzhouxiangella sediminis TaxID=1792836 RepID=A0A3E1K716_9GAMM|nr:glucosaminidase domain-containing protein [Wenzhouxiangella sediminis]RFF29814.1 Bax protein [Wenzhouxiangella sediminis]